MTRINKIVLQGFKSFAKYTKLIFKDNFCCILGPNGSGKSNILDGICFVLGKISSKSLRAEKLANLIYNGGKSKKPAKQGEVSIFFDNSQGIFPTEEKEVKITRIIKPNGQSIYKINDQRRTREQVLELLNMAKIDPDGYNIILQGDIVRFVEMHPVDRRILIEDISGISVYEEKKRKALNDLEKVETKLKEAEIILTERKTRLKELKKERDEAMKFKEMMDKIKIYKASLLKLQIDKKEKELNEFKTRLENNQKVLTQIRDSIQKLKEEIKQRKRLIEEITREIEEKGEVKQLKLNKEIEELKVEIAKHITRVENCENEIKKIKKRKIDLQQGIEEVKEKISQLNNQREKLKRLEEQKLKQKEKLKKKIEALKQRYNLRNINEIEHRIEDIDKRTEELQKEVNLLREKQHNLIRDKDKAEHQLNLINESIKKVKQLEIEYKEQIEKLKRMKEEFKAVTLELNKRLNQDSIIALRLNKAKEKLGKINERFIKLQVRQQLIRNKELEDIAVKKILERRKKIKGIYGTVAELGTVSTKFSLALKIAAGPRIKSIIVENDKIAADCIKYLKKNKLGVATFLPLNKIQHKKPKLTKLATSRGCYGLALDLITYDKKFEKVFAYVFSDTLVVDNIDVARRIGIGKVRMVTIDGDLAERSGLMRGGYRKKVGFGFKEVELNKDLEECKETIQDLEKQIALLEKEQKNNQLKITSLRKKKAQLEGEIIKLERSLHLEDHDLVASRQQKEELRQQIKKIDEEIRKVQKTILNLNKELASLKIEKQKLRTKIIELRDPALVAELSSYEEKLKEIDNEIIDTYSKLDNISIQIESLYKPEIEKTRRIIKELDKEEENFRDEIIKLKSAVKEKQTTLKHKETLAKTFYTRFKDLFLKRSNLNKEIEKNQKTIEKKQDESIKLEIKINTLSLKCAEIAGQLSGLKQEFQQYEGVKLDLSKTEEQLKYQINKYEKLKSEIGYVNMRALEIYDEVEKEYNQLSEKKEKLVKEKNDILSMMEKIENKKRGLFMKTFENINERFKSIFSALTTKGTAYLVLENPENPFEAGIRINVKITTQKFLDIRSLSGGEKTLTALAFIFAIQEYEPASFYIFDEVDAALDKRNSEKFAKLLKEYSQKAQYIIISHNDSIISEADSLYGVSMNEDGVSKIVSLKL